MDYLAITPSEERAMLAAIGCKQVDDLFRDLPKNIPFPEIDFPTGETELELFPQLRALAEQNGGSHQVLSFLGGGMVSHFIPSTVPALSSRSEFATAYTPYQPEVSQGTLQAIFEFQSLVAALAELPVANASLYDGGSALAEAVLMACRVTKRHRVLVAASLHPHYQQVVKAYTGDLPITLVPIPCTAAGTLDGKVLSALLGEDVACVVVAQPNFLGCLEDVQQVADQVHAVQGLLVVHAFPVALGVLAGPGGLGADVVAMDGQSLGIDLSYGGPTVGLFACRDAFARFIPGRVVGETVDQVGKRGYVLTLQTREQHIRREQATSNICTNQALAALRVLIYLALVGRDGLKKRATLCLQKAHYLQDAIGKLSGFSLPFSAQTFSEFVVQGPCAFAEIQAELEKQGILPGISLAPYASTGLFPEEAGCFPERCFLVSVTELHNKADLDRLVSALGIGGSRRG